MEPTTPPVPEMRRARMARDATYDGVFWVGVRTTGIFCRPSCPARPPKEENVMYMDSIVAAQAAGLRACKRCRPTETAGAPPELVRRLLAMSEEAGDQRLEDRELRARGIDPVRARRAFRRVYGVTFQAFHRARRLGEALSGLKAGGDLLEAGFAHGFESASGFAEAFGRRFQATPGRAREVVEVRVRVLESPIGPLQIGATPAGICLLEFSDRRALPSELKRLESHFGAPLVPGTNEHLDRLEVELAEYFAGRRRDFGVPLDLVGTPFQRRVWDALLEIPYGRTCSYGQMAARLDKPGAARAVGRANGANCVAIVVPCHRVVQADGTLRGYGGGLWRKRRLLDLERASLDTLEAEVSPAPFP